MSTYTAQKAALTRAINSKDPAKIERACQLAVRQWRLTGMWPDAWHNWQRALDDSRPWNAPLSLDDL